MKFNLESSEKLFALIGICALACIVSPLKIPVFKLLITLVVAWSAWRLTGDSHRAWNRVSYDRPSDAARIYRYAFSNAALDLTDSDALPEKLYIQAALSGVTIRLPVDVSTIVHARGALCSVSIPGRQNLVLGEADFSCGTRDPHSPRLFVDVSCALGSVAFELG